MAPPTTLPTWYVKGFGCEAPNVSILEYRETVGEEFLEVTERKINPFFQVSFSFLCVPHFRPEDGLCGQVRFV